MDIRPIIIDESVEDTINFFVNGLGGKLMMKIPNQDGKGIMHASVDFHDNENLHSTIEFGDAHDEFTANKANLTFYVSNVKESMELALKHGAKPFKPNKDSGEAEIVVQPWGEEMVQLKFKNIDFTLTKYTGIFTSYMIGTPYEKYCIENASKDPKNYVAPGFNKITCMFGAKSVRETVNFYNDTILNGTGKIILEFPHQTDKNELGMAILTTSTNDNALVFSSLDEIHPHGKDVSLHILVSNVDAIFKKGLTLDPTSKEERATIQDWFWGERGCYIIDPAGTHIFLGTVIPQLEKVTPVIGTTAGTVEELKNFFIDTFDFTILEESKNKKNLKDCHLQYKIGKLSSDLKIVTSTKGASTNLIIYTPNIEMTFKKAIKNGAKLSKEDGKIQQYPWGDLAVDVKFGEFVTITLSQFNGEFSEFMIGSKYQRYNTIESNEESFLPRCWSLINITLQTNGKTNVRELSKWYNDHIMMNTGISLSEMSYPDDANKLAMVIMVNPNNKNCFMFTDADPLNCDSTNTKYVACNEFVVRDINCALMDVEHFEHDAGKQFGQLCQDIAGNSLILLTNNSQQQTNDKNLSESPTKKSKKN